MAETNTGGYAGAASVVANMYAGYMKSKADKKRIKEQNRRNKAAWDKGVLQLREQLGVLHNRGETVLSDINRNKLIQQLSIRKAAHAAKGTARVQAAQLGIGGKRASRAITADIEREEANLVSEAAISAQTEMDNIVNQLNDTAASAITALNTQAVYDIQEPSSGEALVSAFAAGVDAYTNLSATQQSDVTSIFKFKQRTKLDTPQIKRTGQGQVRGL